MDIRQKDIVSITGCGGKTTLMLKLAEELRAFKTLITTTTKIFPPAKTQYDHFYLGTEDIKAKKGITLAANGRTFDGKLDGYDPEILNKAVRLFDFVIIESDGAKMRYLKGWNESEPVIASNTTKTVGVVNLKLLGAGINTENIHRQDIYMKNFCKAGDCLVSLEQIRNLVLSSLGLFKSALGEKILFLNMIESESDKAAMGRLADALSRAGFHDKIVYGSLLKEEYGIWSGKNENK